MIFVALWRFPKVWEVNDEYDFLINSIVVTVLTMIISLSIGLLAGYGLARYTGISGAVILIVALGFRALPRTAFVLPYFFGAKEIDDWLTSSGLASWDFPLIDFPGIDTLQILDTRLAIVLALVAVNQPFTIWMFRSFFMEVPKEIEEAAMMGRRHPAPGIPQGDHPDDVAGHHRHRSVHHAAGLQRVPVRAGPGPHGVDLAGGHRLAHRGRELQNHHRGGRGVGVDHAAHCGGHSSCSRSTL